MVKGGGVQLGAEGAPSVFILVERGAVQFHRHRRGDARALLDAEADAAVALFDHLVVKGDDILRILLHGNPLDVGHACRVVGGGVFQRLAVAAGGVGNAHKAGVPTTARLPIGGLGIVQTEIFGETLSRIATVVLVVVGKGDHTLSGIAVVGHTLFGAIECHTVNPHLGLGTVEADDHLGEIAGIELHRAQMPLVIPRRGINLAILTGAAIVVGRVGGEGLGGGIEHAHRGVEAVVVRDVRTLHPGREGVVGVFLHRHLEGVPLTRGLIAGVKVQALVSVGGGGIVHHLDGVAQEVGVVPLAAVELLAIAVFDEVGGGAGAVGGGAEGSQRQSGGGGEGHVRLLHRGTGHRLNRGILAGADIILCRAGAIGHRRGGVALTVGHCHTENIGDQRIVWLIDTLAVFQQGGRVDICLHRHPGLAVIDGFLDGYRGGLTRGHPLQLAAVVVEERGRVQHHLFALIGGQGVDGVIVAVVDGLAEIGDRTVCHQQIHGAALGVGLPAPLEAALIAHPLHLVAEFDLDGAVLGLVHTLCLGQIPLGEQHGRGGVHTVDTGHRTLVGIAVAAHDVHIHLAVQTQIVAVGGDGAGNLGHFFLHHLVYGVDEVEDVFLGGAKGFGGEAPVIGLVGVVNLVLHLVGEGDERHHVVVLPQHLTQGFDKFLGVVIRHGIVAVHTAEHIPHVGAVIVGGGRGVEADVPHHRHTDIAANIQETSHVGEIFLFDTQHVAVVVVDDSLSVGRAGDGQHIVAQGFEVIDFGVDVIGAVGIDAHLIEIVPSIGNPLGGHLVGGEAATEIGVGKPGIPDALNEAVPLQDLLIQGLGGTRLGGGGDRHRGGGHQRHQQAQRTQKRKQFFHQYAPRFV